MTNHIHIYVGGKTKDGVKEDASAILSVLDKMGSGIVDLKSQLRSGNISQSAKSIARTLEMNAKTVSQDIVTILNL